MNYPTSREWVRVSRLADKYAHRSAGTTAAHPEVHPEFKISSFHQIWPFGQVPDAAEEYEFDSGASAHVSRMAVVKQTLHATMVHVCRSMAVIADVQESISLTLQAIRASQQLILASDLAIERTRTLDCK